MAQRKPEEQTPFVQALKLVEKLTPEEQAKLRRKLDESWGQRFHQICDEIESDRTAKGLPRLTDEEIMAEVKAVREQMKAERVHQSGS